MKIHIAHLIVICLSYLGTVRSGPLENLKLDVDISLIERNPAQWAAGQTNYTFEGTESLEVLTAGTFGGVVTSQPINEDKLFFSYNHDKLYLESYIVDDCIYFKLSPRVPGSIKEIFRGIFAVWRRVPGEEFLYIVFTEPVNGEFIMHIFIRSGDRFKRFVYNTRTRIFYLVRSSRTVYTCLPPSSSDSCSSETTALTHSKITPHEQMPCFYKAEFDRMLRDELEKRLAMRKREEEAMASLERAVDSLLELTEDTVDQIQSCDHGQPPAHGHRDQRPSSRDGHSIDGRPYDYESLQSRFPRSQQRDQQKMSDEGIPKVLSPPHTIVVIDEDTREKDDDLIIITDDEEENKEDEKKDDKEEEEDDNEDKGDKEDDKGDDDDDHRPDGGCGQGGAGTSFDQYDGSGNDDTRDSGAKSYESEQGEYGYQGRFECIQQSGRRIGEHWYGDELDSGEEDVLRGGCPLDLSLPTSVRNIRNQEIMRNNKMIMERRRTSSSEARDFAENYHLEISEDEGEGGSADFYPINPNEYVVPDSAREALEKSDDDIYGDDYHLEVSEDEAEPVTQEEFDLQVSQFPEYQGTYGTQTVLDLSSTARNHQRTGQIQGSGAAAMDYEVQRIMKEVRDLNQPDAVVPSCPLGYSIPSGEEYRGHGESRNPQIYPEAYSKKGNTLLFLRGSKHKSSSVSSYGKSSKKASGGRVGYAEGQPPSYESLQSNSTNIYCIRGPRSRFPCMFALHDTIPEEGENQGDGNDYQRSESLVDGIPLKKIPKVTEAETPTSLGATTVIAYSGSSGSSSGMGSSYSGVTYNPGAMSIGRFSTPNTSEYGNSGLFGPSVYNYGFGASSSSIPSGSAFEGVNTDQNRGQEQSMGVIPQHDDVSTENPYIYAPSFYSPISSDGEGNADQEEENNENGDPIHQDNKENVGEDGVVPQAPESGPHVAQLDLTHLLEPNRMPQGTERGADDNSVVIDPENPSASIITDDRGSNDPRSPMAPGPERTVFNPTMRFRWSSLGEVTDEQLNTECTIC